MISTRDLASFLETDLDSLEHHIKTMVLSGEGLGNGYSQDKFLSAAESLSHKDAEFFLREVRACPIPHALRILHHVGQGYSLGRTIREVRGEDVAESDYPVDVSIDPSI